MDLDKSCSSLNLRQNSRTLHSNEHHVEKIFPHITTVERMDWTNSFIFLFRKKRGVPNLYFSSRPTELQNKTKPTKRLSRPCRKRFLVVVLLGHETDPLEQKKDEEATTFTQSPFLVQKSKRCFISVAFTILCSTMCHHYSSRGNNNNLPHTKPVENIVKK